MNFQAIQDDDKSKFMEIKNLKENYEHQIKSIKKTWDKQVKKLVKSILAFKSQIQIIQIFTPL